MTLASLPFADAADWLCTFALHSTCALGCAWLLGLALRQRATAWQERLLRFSLWAALVSSTVQFTTVGSPLPLALPDVRVVEPAGPADASAPTIDLAALAGTTPAPGHWAPGALPWAAVVVAAAAASALLGLVWLWRTHRRLAGVLADRQPEVDARVLATAAAIATELGLRQSPHMSRCNRLATPIAFGWLRPEICLPSRVGGLTEASLRALLAHEIAHLRRGDPAWMWLAASLQALFPWQPLFAIVRRRWARLVELRCDAVAARHTSPTAVARCLLDVADWLRPNTSVPLVALGMAARPSALRERIEAALQPAAGAPPRRLFSAAFGGLSLSALTFAAPGVQTAVHAPVASPGEGAIAAFAPAGADAAPQPAPSSLRAAAELLLVEHASLTAEVARLRADQRGRPSSPELEQLMSTLSRRLLTLERLRGRLQAKLDRREPAQDR